MGFSNTLDLSQANSYLEKIVDDLEKTRCDRIAPAANQSQLIGKALSLFSGEMRTARRSTGGRSGVTPYQILFYDRGKNQPPEIRLRVKFKDFKFGRAGALTNGKVVTHTKVVSPKDLLESVNYDLTTSSLQPFVLDFGRGIVPVYVLHYEFKKDTVIAYFIEMHQLGELLRAPSRSTLNIQVYSVDRELLRVADLSYSEGRKSEYDFAKDNYMHLRANEKVVVPHSLRFEQPVELPGGLTPKDIRAVLAMWINRQRKQDPDTEENTEIKDLGGQLAVAA